MVVAGTQGCRSTAPQVHTGTLPRVTHPCVGRCKPHIACTHLQGQHGCPSLRGIWHPTAPLVSALWAASLCNCFEAKRTFPRLCHEAACDPNSPPLQPPLHHRSCAVITPGCTVHSSPPKKAAPLRSGCPRGGLQGNPLAFHQRQSPGALARVGAARVAVSSQGCAAQVAVQSMHPPTAGRGRAASVAPRAAHRRWCSW